MRWLVPRLTQFKALHPKTDIQVVTSHEPAISGVRISTSPFTPIRFRQKTPRRRACFAGWGFFRRVLRERLDFEAMDYGSLEDIITHFWKGDFIKMAANNILSMM